MAFWWLLLCKVREAGRTLWSLPVGPKEVTGSCPEDSQDSGMETRGSVVGSLSEPWEGRDRSETNVSLTALAGVWKVALKRIFGIDFDIHRSVAFAKSIQPPPTHTDICCSRMGWIQILFLLYINTVCSVPSWASKRLPSALRTTPFPDVTIQTRRWCRWEKLPQHHGCVCMHGLGTNTQMYLWHTHMRQKERRERSKRL